MPHEHKGTKYLNREEMAFSIRKNMHIIVQIVLVCIIVTAVTVDSLSNRNQVNVTNTAEEIVNESTPRTLDELSATEIAASVALSSNNLVRGDVVSRAESIGAQETFGSTGEEFISKPATPTNDGSGRSAISTHTVEKGETIETIAKLYGIKSETIRWANNLAGNNIKVGEDLLIPPVDGILYTVKNGDTAQSIAKRFSSDAERIIAANDAEISGLQSGTRIVIPGARPLTGASGAPTPGQKADPSLAGSTFGSLGDACEPNTPERLGRVSAGETIGYMGSTGSSSGKHLHLGLCENGNYIDPVANRQSREMVAGFKWPVKNRKAEVSRWFDCSRYWAAARGNCPAGWYFHAGLDITESYSKQTPILAIGDGEMIFRGYQYGSGYTVIIRHDNGYVSQYRHMLPF